MASSAAAGAVTEQEGAPATPKSVATSGENELQSFAPSSAVSSTVSESSRVSEPAQQSEGNELSDSETIAMLREQLAAAQSKVSMWERCMTQFMNSMLLSPDMNDMYKEMCSDMLKQALQTVEQIQHLHYVECSFPSVPSEASPESPPRPGLPCHVAQTILLSCNDQC